MLRIILFEKALLRLKGNTMKRQRAFSLLQLLTEVVMVRIEKRLPTSVPVYLASWGEPRVRERTVTENVSPHGARVVSRRSWRPGDGSLVTPLTGEFLQVGTDRKSTRLNSSHGYISYAVFCLKKKKNVD